MPIYESLCLKCGQKHEYIRSAANYLDTPVCCGDKTEKRILTPPLATFDIQPWDSYVSPATGKLITSKAERKADMKASGCREWEGIATERKESMRLKKVDEDKMEQKLDEAAQKAWAQLEPDKKKVLLDS